MLERYRTTGGVTTKVDDLEEGTWVKLVSPTADEADEISHVLGIDRDDLLAAMDPEEKTRVEMEGADLMILVDVPASGETPGEKARNTIPLSIFLTKTHVVTVCAEDLPFLADFHEGRVRGFSTWSRSRFACAVLMRISLVYQRVLVDIDRRRNEFETRIDDIHDENDLLALHALESSLVYLSTSLRGNGNALMRLKRSRRLLAHVGIEEMLEDTIVENQQAIEMAQIYRDVMSGTRDLLSSVMDLRLNEVMRRLTVITMVLSIPTIVSGFYGMNVDDDWMPLANTAHGFGIICILTMLVCIVLTIYLKKRKLY